MCRLMHKHPITVWYLIQYIHVCIQNHHNNVQTYAQTSNISMISYTIYTRMQRKLTIIMCRLMHKHPISVWYLIQYIHVCIWNSPISCADLCTNIQSHYDIVYTCTIYTRMQRKFTIIMCRLMHEHQISVWHRMKYIHVCKGNSLL